jgi:hypothetical protein
MGAAVSDRVMELAGIISRLASSWSCESGVCVCSGIPATTLESRDESFIGFVQQSLDRGATELLLVHCVAQSNDGLQDDVIDGLITLTAGEP